MMTKDERLLLELYNSEEGVEQSVLMEKLHFSPRQIKTILQGLMQANLVKRFGPDEVGLTERGRTVAQSLKKN